MASKQPFQRPTPIDLEHKLADEDFIVSKTDLRGIIKYANEPFIDIVGYTEEELLGKPHNIIRHPDMPKAAFQDLWDTVRQEKSWKGIVKNLCKDGGFYWVDAYVTPSYEDGELVGYMSVRRKPTEQQVADAEALYAELLKKEVS